MADYTGQLLDALGLTDQVGAATVRAYVTNALAVSRQAPQLNSPALVEIPFALINATLEEDSITPKPEAEWDQGQHLDELGIGEEWWEKVHAIPRQIDFGLVLAQTDISVGLFNAYRASAKDLTVMVNNAGAGTSVPDLPALPETVNRLSGLILTIRAIPVGVPYVEDTIDFEFGADTAPVLILARRVGDILPFPEPPLTVVSERLEFLTDVIEALDGKEQRRALRANPRRSFDYRIGIDGDMRRYIEHFIFEKQNQAVGMIVWAEPSYLTASAAVDDTTISVDDTSSPEFREDKLLVVFRNRVEADVVGIETIGANSFTLSIALSHAFPAGTPVYPVRIAYFGAKHGGSLAPVNDKSISLRFDLIDNETFLADLTGWSTYNGKVLFEDPNLINSTMSISHEVNQIVLDGDVGDFSVVSTWDRGKMKFAKGFRMASRADVLKVRKLLHALRGRQASFYIPTFHNDLEIVEDIAGASAVLRIRNVGYVDLVKDRNPFDVIRLVKTDGTTIIRHVESSSVISEEIEELVVDSNWDSSPITVAEVQRIEYILLCRFGSDRMEIRHRDGNGNAEMISPVVTVFE